MVALAATLAFYVALAAILAVFVVNPLVLLLAGSWRGGRGDSAPAAEDTLPRASLVCAFRDSAELLHLKLEEAVGQVRELEQLEVLLVSDGPMPFVPPEVLSARISLLATAERRGKNHALNLGVAQASGEILVFSDVDAHVTPEALRSLLAPFVDPAVGGVCGRRVIAHDGGRSTGPGQRLYLDLDRGLKSLENRIGSLTAAEGKLMAVRRELFQAIDLKVADDLFLALCTVERGRRFVYAPAASAHIPMPSRSPRHELERRRRIVAGSLRALWLKRGLFHPFRYGGYALRLFTNKVLRRLLPVFLLLLLGSTALLAEHGEPYRSLLLVQIAFYAVAASGPLVLATPMSGTRAGRLISAATYFCLGALGSLLGVIDFLLGREPAGWTPTKSG